MKCLKSAVLGFALAVPLIFFSSAGIVSADDETEENAAAVSAAALSAAVRDSDSVISSWKVTLTNTLTKVSHPALYSFLPGGVLNQSENPMFDPMFGLVFSNAHGAWEYDAEKDRYDITYLKLVFQADASYWGQEKTTGNLKLDEKGNLVGTISFGNEKAEFKGERITASAK